MEMENAFQRYATPNGVGLPQESKLASYIQNRQNAGTPVMKAPLVDALSGLSFASPDVLLGARRENAILRKESPTGLAGQTPSPTVRQSPISGAILRESLVQPVPIYRYEENVGGTTYFYPTAGNSPPNAFSAFPSSDPQSDESALNSTASAAVPKNIRADLTERNALNLLPSDPEAYPDLPSVVGNYSELVPLEALPASENMQVLLSSTFKATHTKTGAKYCLRRIHGFRISSAKCLTLVDAWKRLNHTNIVTLKEVFTTKVFGDNSLVLVYDYHPGSITLWAKYFAGSDPLCNPAPFSSDPSAPQPYSHTKNALLRQYSNMLPESLLWHYIIQLTAAVRVIHAAGLACRTLDPTKVIVCGRNRIRLSCIGITDIITSDTVPDHSRLLTHYQQEDLLALGKLVLALSCRSMMGVQVENIQTTIDLVGRTYSHDLKHLITYLLQPGRQSAVPRNINDLMPMIGARFYMQLDATQAYADELEIELGRELDNGRLFRLLSKLSTITERPDLQLDTQWAETGDRYMLKLFRDYVFHQVMPDGRPWVDLAHVVQCLNKVDAGSQEKICLMSRDEQSILVVSYDELKHCLQTSFDDLMATAASSSSDDTAPTDDDKTLQ